MPQPRPLNVKLISHTQHMLGTLFYVWEQSRSNNPVPMPEDIERILFCEQEHSYTADDNGCLVSESLRMLGADLEDDLGYEVQPTRQRLWSVINQIMDEDIPCTENLSFTFAFENMSISTREQMVRHRIGVQVGDNIGVDIVPDLAESTWWSQTMRMLPMGAFFSEGRYLLPESLEGKIVFS